MNNTVNNLGTPEVNMGATQEEVARFVQQKNGGQSNNSYEFDVEPLVFEENLSSSLVTIYKLSKIVNSLFIEVLSGYSGCTITPNTLTGTVDVAIYLEDKNENGKVRSVEKIGGIANASNAKHALIARVNNFNALQKASKAYMLTEDAKGILKAFMPQVPVGHRQTKVFWEKHELEITGSNSNSNNYNDYKIYTKVKDIDINALVEKIYGSENGKYAYQVRLSAPIKKGKNEYLVTIDRLDTKKLKELADEVSPATTQYGINMVSAI